MGVCLKTVVCIYKVLKEKHLNISSQVNLPGAEQHHLYSTRIRSPNDVAFSSIYIDRVAIDLTRKLASLAIKCIYRTQPVL